MRLRNNLLSLVVGALALVGLGGQAQGLGIPVTLASLVVPGATLTSEDGKFTFSNFDAAIAPGGGLNPDLNLYFVRALAPGDSAAPGAGFRLTGPMMVADGNSGFLQLQYTVSGNNGIRITDAHLWFNGSFNQGAGAPAGLGVGVNEDLFGGTLPLGVSLSVSKSSGGFDKPLDGTVFAPQNTFNVLKDVVLNSYSGGGTAHISAVDQTFTIPEPGTLLLGSFGLLGLATLGRKRVR